jgi:hypothetical protein
MRYPLLFAALALCAGCISEHKVPGQQVIGTFGLDATPTSITCAFAEQPDGGFAFDATLSYNPGAAAFMTVGDVDRDAGFDGQVLSSWASGSRLFAECKCNDSVQVQERISVALLSTSQRDAAGGGCPANPLDGGVPAPNDAGIVAPAPTGAGFDAVLACGEQIDDVVPAPDAGCQCQPCSYHYRLEGARK